MKHRALLPLLSLLVALGASAQHERLYIYRNDNLFNSYRWTDIARISYLGDPGAYNRMVVTNLDNESTYINLNRIDSCVTRSTAIPDFFINLTDHPDWTDLMKDADHTKSTEYKATLSLCGNGMYSDLEERTVTLSGRGNSTWLMPKTPYKFKMSGKASVCNLPKAKSFCLINNFIDGTLMRNAIAFWIAQYLKMPFTNHCVPVRLHFNGNCRGQYMLTEKIGISSGSVDINEKTGMLFELDSNFDEPYEFMFSWSEGHIPVMVKDPDIPEIAEKLGTTPEEYWEKWKADFTGFAEAVVNRTPAESLADVVDLESAVNFFIVNNVTCNREIRHPKSLYIHKATIDDVYHFGPVWDFDWAYTFDGCEGFPPDQPLLAYNGDTQAYFFFKHLFANNEFRTLYRKKWNEFMVYGYPQLKKYIEEYSELIEPTAKENGTIWTPYTSGGWNIVTSWEFGRNVSTLKDWLARRVSYCTQHPNLGLWE